MNCNVRECSFGHVHLTKIQISLDICTVWTESSLGVFWTTKDAKFVRADNEYSCKQDKEVLDFTLE